MGLGAFGRGGKGHGSRRRALAALGARIPGRIAALCLVLLLCLPGPTGRAQALGWPGRTPSLPKEIPPAAEGNKPLQEVAPPLAVQQLQEGLAERQPRVRILSPAAEAVLPGGAWTLRLQVADWPLVDAGPLGLGPHLQLRVDDGEPLLLTSTEVTLPELRPGSHRLTVVAARPWGEAVKSADAMAQIRVHRTAANPLTLPEVGSAQLLPISPEGAVAGEPLLLDWLLIDAPLQHLREDDASWRLRVTVNGDSFLVDRQSPLWLRGWRPGRNALQLELLDARGAPLNPPFNSLVREVRLDPSLPRPAWLGPRLSPADLAILLGKSPPPPRPSPSEPPAGADSLAQAGAEAPAEPEAEVGPESLPVLEPEAEAEPISMSEKETERDAKPISQAEAPPAAAPDPTTENEAKRGEKEIKTETAADGLPTAPEEPGPLDDGPRERVAR